MRLIIVGSDKIYAIENFYKKYIEEQGEEVMLFTAQNYFYDYYQKSLINKVIYRTGLSGIIPKINSQFKQAVEQFRPDVIWVFKGMEISPGSLMWAKERKIFLVNYNPDNPFIFSGAGSGNDRVKQSIPLYDLHFTYNLEIKEKLESMGCRTAMLPFGFDLDEKLFYECCAQPEIIKVCFVGNPDKQRADFIQRLIAQGAEIDIYGNNWKNYITHPNVNLFNPVYKEEFWKVLRRYRIQLNLMRVHNDSSHNMRSFEIPAVGGIMLAPDTVEHRLFFNDGQEVFLFSDIKHCLEQIKKILNLPQNEVKQVRENARQRSLHSGYSYKERALASLEYLRKRW